MRRSQRAVGRVAATWFALALLATACGSTVPAGDRVDAFAAEAGESFGPGAGAAAGGEAALTGPSGALTSRRLAAGHSSATAQSPPEISDPPPTGPGFTAKEISVGLSRVRNAPDYAAQFDVDVDRAPKEDVEKALIDYYNARGGLAGRKLVPVYHTYDGASTDSADTQSQAACTTFTQDKRAAIVLNGGGGDVFLGCMTKAGVPNVGSSPVSGADDYYQRFGLYLNPEGFNYTRWARTMADGLARIGFFGRGAKIGVNSIDSPAWRRAITAGLIPALARHGLSVAQECHVRDRQTEADTAGAAADISSCVLKFKTDQVTHVLFLEAENSAAQELTFMRQAEGQEYRPRYGLASMSGPFLLAQSVPPEQLHGSAGVGWLPHFDVTDPKHRPPLNAQAKRCLQILKDAGIPDASDENDLLGRLLLCEAFFLLEHAVARSGENLTATAVVAGAESLGTSFPYTYGFGVRLARDQHDGVLNYRPFAWIDSCQCFRYVGPVTKTSS